MYTFGLICYSCPGSQKTSFWLPDINKYLTSRLYIYLWCLSSVVLISTQITLARKHQTNSFTSKKIPVFPNSENLILYPDDQSHDVNCFSFLITKIHLHLILTQMSVKIYLEHMTQIEIRNFLLLGWKIEKSDHIISSFN